MPVQKLKLQHLLGKKVRVRRLGIPVWLILPVLVILGVTAGQAVGPVLAGSVTGSTGVVLEQAIILSGLITVSGADDAASTTNDEGTLFTVAIETDVGQSQTVAIETDVGQSQTVAIGLSNTSGAEANAILSLNVPAALDVALEANTGSNEAQLNRNQWLIKIPTAGETITLTIESEDDATPGFFTITGSLVQIPG